MSQFCKNCGTRVDGPEDRCSSCSGGESKYQDTNQNNNSTIYYKSSQDILKNLWTGSGICEICGARKPTKKVEFHQNIGAFIMRFERHIDGNLCQKCINKFFWKFTLTTLAIGWLGLISFFVAPFYIISNIISLGGAKGISFRRFILNRYTAILVGIIVLLLVINENDKSYYQTLTTEVGQNNQSNFTPQPAISLATGTVIKRNTTYLQGEGKLEIKNGTNLDAVAKLVRNSTSVLTVYIKANSNYTMTNISNGTYKLAFAQGLDWDSINQKFRRNEQYSIFDKSLSFTATEDGQYYYYSTFEVTLHPVVGGDAETSNVNPDLFDSY